MPDVLKNYPIILAIFIAFTFELLLYYLKNFNETSISWNFLNRPVLKKKNKTPKHKTQLTTLWTLKVNKSVFELLGVVSRILYFKPL